MPPEAPRAPRGFHRLYALALLCFLGALLTGWLAGGVAAFPRLIAHGPGSAALRPLHTLLALAWLFLGGGAATGFFCADERRRFRWLSTVEFWSFLLFLLLALGATATGWFSGFEYVSWPWPATVPLLVAFGANLAVAWSGRRRLAARSPEAAWLVLLGACLLPAALLEHALLGAGRLEANLGATLTLEWHALDTLMTGWSVVLYGAGVLAVAGRAKPLRARGLFVIAFLGILLDFGHHNYPSPQAHAIKLISFAATMLAVVSLFRHVRSQTGDGAPTTPTLLLLRLAGWWTVFALATGILMAVPWINVRVHGTYAVVGHAMGAVIGVNSFLLLAVGYRGETVLRPRQRAWFLGASWALFGLVASFGGLGVAAGFLRTQQDYFAWSVWLRPAYVLLPVAGTAVAVTFGWIAWDLGKREMGRRRRPVASAGVRRPGRQPPVLAQPPGQGGETPAEAVGADSPSRARD